MDLTIDIEDSRLNIRAACVIIHNNKVLVHKNNKNKLYALIGGRIELGEDSVKTVKREVEEELGKSIEVTGYVSTVENFFERGGKKYHEIIFIHKAEFINDGDKNLDTPLKNIEGKEYLEYVWLDIDKIEEYELLPKVTKKILKEKEYIPHIIDRD